MGFYNSKKVLQVTSNPAPTRDGDDSRAQLEGMEKPIPIAVVSQEHNSTILMLTIALINNKPVSVETRTIRNVEKITRVIIESSDETLTKDLKGSEKLVHSN